MASAPSFGGVESTATILKEGWLHKRGEQGPMGGEKGLWGGPLMRATGVRGEWAGAACVASMASDITTRACCSICCWGWQRIQLLDVVYVEMLCVYVCVGEYIKNWRPRWFVLREDGTFHGFKSKPPPGAKTEPLNNFKIDCKSPVRWLEALCSSCLPSHPLAHVNILANDKIKKNAFLLRYVCCLPSYFPL